MLMTKPERKASFSDKEKSHTLQTVLRCALHAGENLLEENALPGDFKFPSTFDGVQWQNMPAIFP